jgi:hypothetical protein
MSLLLSPLNWKLPVGMLRNRKSDSGRRSLLILTFLLGVASWTAPAGDDVPVGYKTDRYQPLWERNPFTLVTPVAAQAKPKVFDKLILLSWLNDGTKDVVFVQNTENNEVQKITTDPNSDNLRLLAIHKAADPKLAEVLLSDGTDEGSVKFRLEVAAAAPQQNGGQPAVPTEGGQNPAPVPVPVGPAPAIMSRQAQAAQNGQQVARFGANQQGMGQMQTAPGTLQPPRASEARRKRLTPPPVVEQPVGEPVPVQNSPKLIQPQNQ